MAASCVLDGRRQDGPGRVAGVAQEECLGPRPDGGLDGRRVEREVVLQAGRDVADDAAGERDRRRVGHVRRLVEDHLVAGVAGRPEGEVDRLGRADGDQDLGRRVVADAIPPRRAGRPAPGGAPGCRSCWCSGFGRDGG